MAFPAAFLDELTARNPIEDVVGQYVNLRRSGSNLFGLCPFHGEKTASFSVAPDKGMYYCFGCHKGGGSINFMMELEGLSYPDAVRALAKRSGMEVPEDEQYQSRYRQQERLWALHKEAARYFHSQLYAPVGSAALQYALGRGMSKGILTTFGVGYAPDSWDSFPIHVRPLRDVPDVITTACAQISPEADVLTPKILLDPSVNSPMTESSKTVSEFCSETIRCIRSVYSAFAH